MYRIVQIDDLDDPRVLEAEAVWNDAYSTDPVTNAMVGGRAELRYLNAKACIRAGIVGGKFYVALTESDKVVGTAIWYPAGKDFLADEQQQQEGAAELLSRIEREDPPLYEWWMTQLVPLLAESTDKFMGKGFKTNNWNLYSLTVMEAHRRNGIARMLVKAGEDQAAALGLSTCFEAENEVNIEIYERLGYEIAGHTYVPGPPTADGFNCYSLVKHCGKEVT